MEDSTSERDQIAGTQRKLSYFMMRLLSRVKFDASDRKLKKVLNLYHLIFLGISCTVGSGAYSIVGLAAQKAGPGIICSFIIVGLLCFFTCLPYAEFASKIQSSGFSYSFVYATCGELLGYITGHFLHLVNIFSTAICARCCCAYIASFISMFGLNIPLWLYDWEVFGCRLCILGALFVIALSLLMLTGMKESTTVNNVISCVNICTLFFAVIAGLFYIDADKYYDDFFPFGAKGIFTGMGLTFYAFLGFEGLTCFTEEALQPEKDLPVSLVITLIIAIIVNGGIALVMTGMAPLALMNNNQSLLAVFKYRCPWWMAVIISIGSISGLTACQSASLMCQPRTFYSMSYDRLLPKAFMRVNPKTQVPDFSIVVTCIVATVITLLFDVEVAGNAVSLCGLLIAAWVDLSVIVARYEVDCGFSKNINRCSVAFFVLTLIMGFSLYYNISLLLAAICAVLLCAIYYYIQKQPQVNMPKSFVCPCVPLVPLIGAASFTLMASIVPADGWIIVLVYAGLGVISYFMYGYWQSKLNPYRRESVASVTQADLPMEAINELRNRLNSSKAES
eukprot:TRINITY_DN7955_c0_g2_i3.p1 TRINITY_DN7955_c0_g2~~TRINITY_DN7955_c0_g2_i3.p1  ORF type:complete len:563 (-),score=110.22 TRINITY_DN7955_c0_g2_i3:152-1840(-)